MLAQFEAVWQTVYNADCGSLDETNSHATWRTEQKHAQLQGWCLSERNHIGMNFSQNSKQHHNSNLNRDPNRKPNLMHSWNCLLLLLKEQMSKKSFKNKVSEMVAA